MFGFSSLRARNRRRQAVRPVEVLESRELLSAINVISTPGPAGSVNVSFLGTEGNDRITMVMGDDMKVHVTGGSFTLNGGAEQTELKFDRLNNVTLSLAGGSDSGRIENVSMRNLVITDGTTATETNQYTVESSTKDVQIKRIDATFNLGIAEFSLNASKSVAVENVDIRLRNTTSSKIIVQAFEGASLNIARQFSVDSAPRSQSADSVLIQAFRNSATDPVRLKFAGGLRLNLGAGNDVIQTAGAAEVSGLTVIDTGKGDDQVNLAVGGNLPVSGDLVFLGATSISTGEGLDFVSISSAEINNDRVRFNAPVLISTGDQNDQVNLYKCVFSSALVVDLGRNESSTTADLIFVRHVQFDGLSFFRSTGRAEANIETVVNSTSTTRFGKAVVFALASGGVVVGNSEATSVRVIFDGSQTYIGTRSKISVKYAGAIQANLQKRRLFNAVLE